MYFYIPATIGVLQANPPENDWARAACVAAFVRPATRGVDPARSPFLTYRQFALLGVPGIDTIELVDHYYSAWVFGDNPYARKGHLIALPDKPFPVLEAA